VDTLHTVGIYQIDSIFISFKYEFNKEFEYKLVDENYAQDFISENPVGLLITETKRIGRKKWKMSVSYR
jgi:hypothetical protein